MTNLEDIKRKIAAMLAKSNDTSVSEPEADAFNRKAHELMTKYNIARAELDADLPVERTHIELVVQVRPWSQAVLSGLTGLYFCKYFWNKLDAKGRKHRVTIIGEKQNVMVCHAIAVMVLRSIQTEAARAGDGRSFMTGAGYRVFERCREMMDYSNKLPEVQRHRALGTSSTGNSLVVLAQAEAGGNQDYIESVLGVKPVQARSSTAKVRDVGAFSRGREHGGKVQLRRHLLS